MFVTSKLMAQHGVNAVFSDREGGVSQSPFDSLNLGFELGDAKRNVEQNIKKICLHAGMREPHQAKQVHATKVLHCTGNGFVHEQEADVLVTSESNVPLAVRTADCLPILLVDPVAQVIAAVHAGWRGTAAQVAQIAVQTMCELGSAPELIVASLGPCIGPCCFEINNDIAAQLEASCGENVVAFSEGKLCADLSEANKLQLLESGLAVENIEMLEMCTVCHTSPSYFSYRRDLGQTGRQLSMISLA